jgi:hypothetical protein
MVNCDGPSIREIRQEDKLVCQPGAQLLLIPILVRLVYRDILPQNPGGRHTTPLEKLLREPVTPRLLLVRQMPTANPLQMAKCQTIGSEPIK